MQAHVNTSGLRWAVLIIALLAAGCATKPTAPVARGVDLGPANVRAETKAQGPSGRTYRIALTDDPGAQAANEAAQEAADAAFGPLTVPAPAMGITEFAGSGKFKGNSRAHAKTTIVTGTPMRVSSLKQLLAQLPDDDSMAARGIDRDTERVAEETRNVGVCVSILATKAESDGDYHVIVADDLDVMMNTEISGIPSWGSKKNRDRLLSVRGTFEDFVDSTGRSTSGYAGWKDPVLVYMEGSLFWDIEHKPGVVGPAFARPKTAWEIHPISKLEFESSKCP